MDTLPPAGTDGPSVPSPAQNVSAERLFLDYQKNEVSADSMYKGRSLAVTGTVSSINKDFTDSVYLVLETSNEFMGVHANLRGSEASKASVLSKGEIVTVVCEGNGMIVGSPMLADCVIQPSQQRDPGAISQQAQAPNSYLSPGRPEAPTESPPGPAGNSTPSVAQPDVPQGPVPWEETSPPAQPTTSAEAGQQAIVLWNQKRHAEAFPLFNRACNDREPVACYYLGVMFDHGQGLAQNLSRARELYLKACQAGNEAACGNLNLVLAYAPDLIQCKPPASEGIASRSAESCSAGNGASCATLGHLYSYGCGVSRDAEKARQAYSKACALGNQLGCERLKEMQ